MQKTLTPNAAFEKLKKYCAYQERSHSEVRHKLLQAGLRGRDLEDIIARLIEEGFLNEERFTLAFARGKFRMKGWGRNKIIQELKARKISGYCIAKAMKEIESSDYQSSLRRLLRKKSATLKEKNPRLLKRKLASFLIGKGYEPDLVWKELQGEESE